MRGLLRPVRTRIGALVGLVALLPIALMLLKHQLDLVAAAKRAAIVFVGVLLFERLLLPVAMMLLSSGRTAAEPDPDVQEHSAGA
jgi:hypothetical protein